MDKKAIRGIQQKLTRWYLRVARDLPWRRTRDPYAILLSEIMLQQTRVAAVIPYFERFLRRFPTPAALASAPEQELLTEWAGLGYYSRARNLQAAAREIASLKTFPDDHAAILHLRGVGTYTAAAVASIAFGLPHAAVDGNVRRVVIRLTNDPKAEVEQIAELLLDHKNPGRWNQAVMELGATVCLPREPLCETCPVRNQCAAYKAGTARDLPPKSIKPAPEYRERTLLVIRRDGRILLTSSPRVRDFWDLPEPTTGIRVGAALGQFKHTITHRHYRFNVCEGIAKSKPAGARWFTEAELNTIPLSTTAKKALLLTAGK